MSVLQEIISEATLKHGDVSRMLRLCQVLGARLKHEPLKMWVRNELEGYGPNALLPQYRIFTPRSKGHFIGLGYKATLDIPTSILPEKLRPQYEKVELRSCIAEYADLLDKTSSNGTLEIPWPVELSVHHASKLVVEGQCIQAWMEISSSEVAGMIDQIKTRVLGFALDIEAEAPGAGNTTGSFAEVSKEKVTHIFMTHIQGNIGILQTGSSSSAHINDKQSTLNI